MVATKGLLTSVAAAVNLSDADHAILKEYVPELVHAWDDDPCSVQVVLMPDEEDKGSEPWPLYTGPMEGKALQAWAVELFPNLVTRVSADGLDGFLMTLRVDVPKVCVFFLGGWRDWVGFSARVQVLQTMHRCCWSQPRKRRLPCSRRWRTICGYMFCVCTGHCCPHLWGCIFSISPCWAHRSLA